MSGSTSRVRDMGRQHYINGGSKLQAKEDRLKKTWLGFSKTKKLTEYLNEQKYVKCTNRSESKKCAVTTVNDV